MGRLLRAVSRCCGRGLRAERRTPLRICRGSVILARTGPFRKGLEPSNEGRHFGYRHIPKLFAREVNAFARDVLSPYLNFHRPCLFPTEITDAKGATRR